MDADGKETLPPLIQTPETESYSSVVAWDFEARGGRGPLRLYWYDGGMKPHRPIELDRRVPMPGSGLLFVGSKGKLLAGYYGGGHRLLPEARFRDFTAPAKTLPRSPGHYREWIAACKGGPAANCEWGFAGKMVETALLGTLAARTARLLEWDSANLRVTNDAEANALVNPPRRRGWEI
jgi:hypothetical protein